MIHVAIEHLAERLNARLQHVLGLHEDIVVVSGLVELDGTVSPHTNNRIVIGLVNVERDAAAHFERRRPAATGGRQVVSARPLFVNLHLMIAANFSGRNYTEALKFLSTTVEFFQGSPVFDHATSPGLDQRIEHLTLEIENLSFTELASVWSMMGGKYLPSVLYLVRMVVIDDADVIAQLPTVSRPETRMSGRLPRGPESDDEESTDETDDGDGS